METQTSSVAEPGIRTNEKSTQNKVGYLDQKRRKIIFILASLLCLMPFMSPSLALILGLITAQLMGNPFIRMNEKAISLLLKLSVVGLGFGMNLFSTLKAGKEGALLTVICILVVLTAGFLLGRLFKTEHQTSILISAGTAICGGSAIAALSPVMKAEQKHITAAMGTVFILNSIALLLFPAIGQALGLSQKQFGTWCAIAIHDTSSVISAAGQYGEQALQVATTLKLARSLWIVPVAFGLSIIFKNTSKRLSPPYFIVFFCLAILAHTFFLFIKPLVPYILGFARSTLTLCLFLIGSGLSLNILRTIGLNPFLQGLLLWIAISGLSLWAIVGWF